MLKLPGATAVHEIRALPDTAIVPGVIGLQDSPGGIISSRVIVPENWFRAFKVRVEFDGLFTLVGAVEPALIVKSCTM